MFTRAQRLEALEKLARSRILIIDGAMGTMIQQADLTEDDFRGDRFKGHKVDQLKGNNDLLNLTRPDVIGAIHRAYFEAGADMVETNTFSATFIAQADYKMERLASEIAEAGARIARAAADAMEAETGSPKGVLGALGPTNKTLSISPDVTDPGYRDVDFDTLERAYREQAAAMAPHVDFLLIETVFDTLNAKAAIMACQDAAPDLPIIVSGTITDRSGRTLSGQTAEAFMISIAHAEPWAVGLNCALGAAEMRPFLAEMARTASTRVIAYPNAGLPNEMGGYDETPEDMADALGGWAKDGLVNLLGGCCGSTPEHIGAIAEAARGVRPREIPAAQPVMRLSGLEPFKLAG